MNNLLQCCMKKIKQYNEKKIKEAEKIKKNLQKKKGKIKKEVWIKYNKCELMKMKVKSIHKV